jgi:hypothetical protein
MERDAEMRHVSQSHTIYQLFRFWVLEIIHVVGITSSRKPAWNRELGKAS